MTDQKWHEQRRSGIGGSDVAAILGLSEYSTPFHVWQQKRGEVQPVVENELMRWGRYLEPAIRQAYSDTTGRPVLVTKDMLRHPKHEFMIANLDGHTPDNRGFEAKTARTSQGWGVPGTDSVPQAYMLQVQHYMAVTSLRVFDVAVLIGGSDFRIYEVPADIELQEMLINAEREFWQCVQSGEPPDPVTYRDVVARWGRRSTTSLAMATDEVLHAISRLHELKHDIEAMEAAEEAQKAIVMKHMNESDTLVDRDGVILATWRATKPPQRFDSKALQKAHPELYAEFVREGEPSRRFLLKDL